MKNIVKAVFTLTIFSLLDRILGFAFKIYLSRELGAVALGIYQVALSVFFLLMTLTTSGIPLIVSKLTAKFKIRNTPLEEHKTVSAALVIGLVLSVLICIIFYSLSGAIKYLFVSPESMTILMILLPGVIFSGIYAAFRGSLWGHQRYKTVSIIEVCEQIFRIIVCVILFMLGYNKLQMTALTLTLSCCFTAICCILCYFAQKGKLANPKGYIVPLIKQSGPITVIRASNSFVNSLVAIAVPFLLMTSGFSRTDSLYVYGSSVGMAFPLLYIPITVVGSLAYVLIPTISTAIAKNEKSSVCKHIESAISFAIVIAALFVPVFFSLGKEIGVLVYDNEMSGNFLKASAWLLIPVAVESITSSMMNSLDLEKSSFLNYAIGSVALFGILFAFYGNFKIEVLIYAMCASLTISSVLDIRKVCKATGAKLPFLWTLLKSGILIIPTSFLITMLKNSFSFMPPILSIGISALIGIAFFAGLAYVFGLFDFSGIIFTSKRKKNRLLKKEKQGILKSMKNEK